MAPVSLEKINKVYENGFHAVHDLSVTIADGEFMVLVGPSGCGKTTALRMVAGLEDITSGVLRIGGKEANDETPKQRDIAMVFQNYALYPHMSVAENIGFALKLRKLPKSEVAAKVKETAEILGLSDWLDRKPGQLSGGQRQRVGAVLGAVVRQQVDHPQALYAPPDNLFVGAFIGSPAMNLYEAALTEGARSLRIGSQEIDLPQSVRDARPRLTPYANEKVVVGLRPEHLPVAVNG